MKSSSSSHRRRHSSSVFDNKKRRLWRTEDIRDASLLLVGPTAIATAAEALSPTYLRFRDSDASLWTAARLTPLRSNRSRQIVMSSGHGIRETGEAADGEEDALNYNRRRWHSSSSSSASASASSSSSVSASHLNGCIEPGAGVQSLVSRCLRAITRAGWFQRPTFHWRKCRTKKSRKQNLNWSTILWNVEFVYDFYFYF